MSLVVASVAVLGQIAQADPSWIDHSQGDPPEGISAVLIGPDVYLYGLSDVPGGRVVCVRRRADGTAFGPDARDSEHEPILERIVQFAERARSPKVQTPANWGTWVAGSQYAFAAATINQNPRGLRLVVLVDSAERSVLVWDSYRRGENVDLDKIDIDRSVLLTASAEWRRNLDRGKRVLESAAAGESTSTRHVTIAKPGKGSERSPTTYSQWLTRLTESQRNFLENDATHSLSLSGPAGSGKTLSLQLKALREVYRAWDAEGSARVLFATHSWSSADQVHRDMQVLDERNGLDCIDIMPLSSLADDLTPSATWRPEGMNLLGDDSQSDRELQAMLIADVLERFLATDWFTYKGSCSTPFVKMLESTGLANEETVDDLAREFGCVLAAENIFRGRDAEHRYLSLRRGMWMMPLESTADRKAVFSLYQAYLKQLRENSWVTTDLLMSEFYRYLQGNAWDIRRDQHGYELVVVDEVHLFNVQEKMALRCLMRDPMSWPRVCAAYDLRQSPRVRQAEVGLDGELVELKSVHRFSPQILEFVQHIHDHYPTLDLGTAWDLDLDGVSSSAEDGPRPTMAIHHGRDDTMTQCLDRANELRSGGEAVAVIVLDPDHFGEYKDFAQRASNYTVIAGRDDLLALQYEKRSVVLGLAEYVAGLQFDNVLIVEVPSTLSDPSRPAYRHRDDLTLLYLAASRASKRLEFFIDGDAALPEVLSLAEKRGALVRLR